MKYEESIDSDIFYDNDEIEVVDEDDSAFDPLIDDAYQKLDAHYQKEVDNLMPDTNLTESDAKQEANELFLARERQMLMKDYRP